MTEKTIYVSVDMESNGPCPGLHSMLSVGAVAFTEDKKIVSKFARNLELWENTVEDPSTMEFWDKFRFAYESTRLFLVTPQKAMTDMAKWVDGLKELGNVVFIAAPLAFDWKWIDWYSHNTIGYNPFGFGNNSIDVKSFVWHIFGDDFSGMSDDNYPREWYENKPHPHIAVEDALEQGIMFLNALQHSKTLMGKTKE